MIENIQRENLNPVEEARAYESILKKHKSNYDELSKIVGKSKSHISNMLRLLDLDKEILDYIISGKISETISLTSSTVLLDNGNCFIFQVIISRSSQSFRLGISQLF